MIDLAGALELSAQGELFTEHGDRARAKCDNAILSGLRRVFVDARDPRFADTQCAVHRIEIRDEERDLFRRPEPGEESEFVVVALCFAEVAMDGLDQRFGVVDSEWIDDGTIPSADARALEGTRRIKLVRMIVVAEFECSPQDADGVVVRFLAPVRLIAKGDEHGILNAQESQVSEPWTPESIQYASIGCHRDRRHVILCHSRSTVRKELVKDLRTGARGTTIGDLSEVAVVGKLFRE